MSELQHVLDPYGDFVKEIYFKNLYTCIPSQLDFQLPLELNKKNIEAVLAAIDFSSHDLTLVYKKWKTSPIKFEETSKDFPNEYFYKSGAKDLCIWISFPGDELSIEFFYNHEDTELEDWILSTFKNLRDKFGKKKSAVFKVLSKSNGEFYTENININDFDLDLEKMYNEDFPKIHTIINRSLELEMSGLILLHGTPGTGKTSYIKSLLSSHAQSKFIFIPNDFVNELLQPDFISFLISHKNSILVIEDAEKVITSRDNTNQNSVVSTILQLTDGLFSDYLNIKIVCTFNTSIDKIDKALLRKGRMIAFYEFKALSVAKTNKLMESLGQEADHTEKTLAEIFNFSDTGFEDMNDSNSIGFQP